MIRVQNRLKLCPFFEAALKKQNAAVHCLAFLFTNVAINGTWVTYLA